MNESKNVKYKEGKQYVSVDFFAHHASVTKRTLCYYRQMGILPPLTRFRGSKKRFYPSKYLLKVIHIRKKTQKPQLKEFVGQV